MRPRDPARVSFLARSPWTAANPRSLGHPDRGTGPEAFSHFRSSSRAQIGSFCRSRARSEGSASTRCCAVLLGSKRHRAVHGKTCHYTLRSVQSSCRIRKLIDMAFNLKMSPCIPRHAAPPQRATSACSRLAERDKGFDDNVSKPSHVATQSRYSGRQTPN